MIQFSKVADETRGAGPMECWCLHGAVGVAADWREFSKNAAASAIGTRAVDLWRFLECSPMSLPDFAKALNAEAGGEVKRGIGRALLGYSMGARMALHALAEPDHPWQAAVIVSGHPGLENESDRSARRAADAEWGTRAFTTGWTEFLRDWNAQPVLGNAMIRNDAAMTRLVSRRQEIARSFIDWSLGNQEPLWNRLAEIRIPVLWIVGEKDEKFRAIAERAVGLLPKAKLVVAPGAGHRVPWEVPEWFAREVTHFLKTGDSDFS